MLRILIIVFSLSAFAPPASALVLCEMMNGGDMVSMDHDMSSMSETDNKKCNMHEGKICNSTQCATSCSANFPPMAFAPVKDFYIDLQNVHQQNYLQYLYRIYLPINTPPPLV